MHAAHQSHSGSSHCRFCSSAAATCTLSGPVDILAPVIRSWQACASASSRPLRAHAWPWWEHCNRNPMRAPGLKEVLCALKNKPREQGGRPAYCLYA